MAEWTQKEIEDLLAEMTRKSMTDMEFRKEVLEDANAALEKLAGRPLPNGVKLKCIEKDPNYQSTFVLPDLLDEEKLDDESLANVAGGISVAAIISICAAAAGFGPDAILCAAKACFMDVGSRTSCAAEACAGHECHWESKSSDNYACSRDYCNRQECFDRWGR